MSREPRTDGSSTLAISSACRYPVVVDEKGPWLAQESVSAAWVPATAAACSIGAACLLAILVFIGRDVWLYGLGESNGKLVSWLDSTNTCFGPAGGFRLVDFVCAVTQRFVSAHSLLRG